MTIKIKRDTAANWTSVNPVLAVGQPGHDTTNNQIRVGNGSSAWTALTPISGGGVTDGDKGDIVVSSGGTVWTIDAGAVTLADMANIATATMIGRATAGTGAPEALTVAQVKTVLAYTPADIGAATSAQANATHTGDATGATALTLATVNANVGSWGLAGSVAQFTVNAKGLVTAAANLAISIASTAISDGTAAGRAFLTAATAAAQTALLDVFTSGAKGLAPASGGGTTNFLRADGTWAAPAGGGGGLTGATATINFGAAPGTNLATLVVTGQGAITSTSRIKVWFQGGSTADFNEYEHLYILPSSVKLSAATIINGVGFTIYATTQLRIRGNVVCRWEWS